MPVERGRMSGALSFSRLTWRQLQMLTANRGYRAMALIVSLLLFLGALRGGRESAIAIAAYRTAVNDELQHDLGGYDV